MRFKTKSGAVLTLSLWIISDQHNSMCLHVIWRYSVPTWSGGVPYQLTDFIFISFNEQSFQIFLVAFVLLHGRIHNVLICLLASCFLTLSFIEMRRNVILVLILIVFAKDLQVDQDVVIMVVPQLRSRPQIFGEEGKQFTIFFPAVQLIQFLKTVKKPINQSVFTVLHSSPENI